MTSTKPTSTALYIARRSSFLEARAGAAARKHRRMLLLGDGGTRVEVPFAPREVTYGGGGAEWEEVDRGPGRKPLRLAGGLRLRTMSFTLTVASLTGRPIASTLAGLQRLRDRQERVAVSWSPFPGEAGLWRLELEVASTQREEGTNAVRVAAVTITLTEVADPPRLRFVAARPPAPKPALPAKPKAARVHVFRKGDTYWGLAERFYGDGTKWRTIARANRPVNVYRIPIGFRATIPPRP